MIFGEDSHTRAADSIIRMFSDVAMHEGDLLGIAIHTAARAPQIVVDRIVWYADRLADERNFYNDTRKDLEYEQYTLF
jgi:HD superfamily phosphohydrolase YqeK